MGEASLAELWDRLQQVRTVDFITHSASATGWSGSGRGGVTVESPAPAVLLFHEAGTWRPAGGRDLQFRNVYRWRCTEETVQLEHLRFGEAHPVFLFALAPDSEGTWSSVTPHLCHDDTYTAWLRIETHRIVLVWTILGPKKNERIEYTYAL